MQTHFSIRLGRLVASIACYLSCSLLGQAQSLNNGGFDNIAAACASDVATRVNPFADGCVPGWNSSHGTPDINGSSSDYYAFMFGGLYGSAAYSEGIFTSYPFQSGQQYSFTFFARNVGVQAGSPTLILNVATGLQESGNQTALQDVPTAGITRQQVGSQVVTGSWAQYTVTFTPSISATQFWLFTQSNYQVSSLPHQIEVNGLTVTCRSEDVYYQNTASLPALTKTTGSIFAGSNPNPSLPTGPVTVSSGQSVSFRALKTIALTSEFSVESGAEFSAVSVPCPGYNRLASPDSVNNAPPLDACGCLRYASKSATPGTNELGIANALVANETLTEASPAPSLPEVAVYPNPAYDYMTIELPITAIAADGSIIPISPDADGGRVGIIYDSYGLEAARVRLHEGLNKLAVSELKPGIYYLHTAGKGKPVKVRFSVKH